MRPPWRFQRQQFSLGGGHGVVLAGLLGQGGVVDQPLGGVGTGHQVSQLELGVLLLEDRTAELLALLGVLDGLLDGALGDAQSLGGDADPAAVQRGHGQVEAPDSPCPACSPWARCSSP